MFYQVFKHVSGSISDAEDRVMNKTDPITAFAVVTRVPVVSKTHL